MLGATTRITHSLAAISVGDHTTELIIYKRICVTALVVVLLFLQLLFQLLKKTFEKDITVFEPVMMDFQQKHNAYKFQIAVSIVYHKAVDPAVVTQPPGTLTSEMVAVYADAPPHNDVNRQLLHFIEVYGEYGSGWVFFKLCFLTTDIMAP